MNPRRVHDLMHKHFPPLETVEHDWINVAERSGLRVGLIEALLDKYIAAPEVVIEVHRKLGAFLPKHEAVAYIGTHLGKGHIRIADRAFTSFVVVASNGVATGWHAPADNSSQGMRRDEAAPHP